MVGRRIDCGHGGVGRWNQDGIIHEGNGDTIGRAFSGSGASIVLAGQNNPPMIQAD